MKSKPTWVICKEEGDILDVAFGGIGNSPAAAWSGVADFDPECKTKKDKEEWKDAMRSHGFKARRCIITLAPEPARVETPKQREKRMIREHLREKRK